MTAAEPTPPKQDHPQLQELFAKMNSVLRDHEADQAWWRDREPLPIPEPE